MKALTRRLLMLLLYVTTGFLLSLWLLTKPPTPPPGPTIEQVQLLSQLVSMRVQVADVTTTEIKGYTGGSQAALMVKGDVLLSVDLTQARFESQDQQAKTAVLVLPQPQVLSPRIDHSQTRIFALGDYGIWKIVPSDVGKRAALDRAYQKAEKVIERAGGEDELLERAKGHTEEVIGKFFEGVGWKVKVTWAAE